MITVSILINGKPIYTRSARNIATINAKPGETLCEYAMDDGSRLFHVQEHGAPALAKMMLSSVKDELLHKEKEDCPPFNVGDMVMKIITDDKQTYDEGEVRVCYKTKAGGWRVMVENHWRQQHVYSPNQLKFVGHAK